VHTYTQYPSREPDQKKFALGVDILVRVTYDCITVT